MTRLFSICTLLAVSLARATAAAADSLLSVDEAVVSSSRRTTSIQHDNHSEQNDRIKRASPLWTTESENDTASLQITRRQQQQRRSPNRRRLSSKSTKSSSSSSSSSSRSKGSKADASTCFTSAAEAGALGTIVLQSLWYEILATQCDRLAIRETVFFKFFTPDVTLQAANATVLANNREGVFQAWINDLHTDCLAARDNNVAFNWQLQSVVTEDGIYDDLVWQGQWISSGTTSSSSQYYFMIQLGGHRGGHSLLYGYQSSQRESPRQSECYEPVIYAMVQFDDRGSTTV